MYSVEDVLYLLDVGGIPERSLNIRYDLSVEHVLDESSILTVSIPIDEKLEVEQQFVYQNNRFTVSEIETSKATRTKKITADIVYLELNDDLCTVKLNAATTAKIATEVLAGTRWTVGTIAYNSDNHSINVEDESPLSALRLLSVYSELVLVFNTFDWTVSFLSVDNTDVGYLFSYKKNLQDITRREFAPKATALIPYGNEGMTIESVNGGINYVENYDWYLAKGYTLVQSRELFNKTHTFEDGRFIYPGNLMKEAERRLDILSKPQVAYDVSVTSIDKDVTIGDYGYVVDEELGIKVAVRIVRYIQSENEQNSSIELNYLIPNLSALQDNSGASGSGGGLGATLVDNQRVLTIGSNYVVVGQLDFSVSAATHASASIAVVGMVSHAGILEGIIDIDGNPLPYRIWEAVMVGPKTFNLSFVATQIQEGTHTLRVMMRVDNGTFTVKRHDAHLFVQSENLVGGIGTELPKIDAVDEVSFIPPILVTDNLDIKTAPPTPATLGDTVTFKRITATDALTIELN